MTDAVMDARDELTDLLDELADTFGQSTVMQWCLEWEQLREQHVPAEKRGEE